MLSFSFRVPGMSDSVSCTGLFQINETNDNNGALELLVRETY